MHGKNSGMSQKLSFTLRNRGASKLDFIFLMEGYKLAQLYFCVPDPVYIMDSLSPAGPVKDFYSGDSWYFP